MLYAVPSNPDQHGNIEHAVSFCHSSILSVPIAHSSSRSIQLFRFQHTCVFGWAVCRVCNISDFGAGFDGSFFGGKQHISYCLFPPTIADLCITIASAEEFCHIKCVKSKSLLKAIKKSAESYAATQYHIAHVQTIYVQIFKSTMSNVFVFKCSVLSKEESYLHSFLSGEAQYYRYYG